MSYGDAFRQIGREEFRDILNIVASDMIDLLSDKRESYGPDNLTRFGEFGILVRVGDKVERLAHMHRQGLDVTAVGESYNDAWVDIMGYAMLQQAVEYTESSDYGRYETHGESIGGETGRTGTDSPTETDSTRIENPYTN